jgi:hypothetical protein
MLLTTLIWSYLHLVFVAAPLLSAKLVGGVIESLAYRRLQYDDHGNALDNISGTLVFLRNAIF